MTNKQREILEYIKNEGFVTAHNIAKVFSIGGSMTHRHLKNLLEQGLITKQGIPPKVFYSFNGSSNACCSPFKRLLTI